MLCLNTISVGSRSSKLAQTQVQEVLLELKQHHPHIDFEVSYIHSTGDLDLLTSLRDLGQTDFFTKELDEMVLNGDCRIAIHSAKDLPAPLPIGLKLICLTKGLDCSDALVLKPGMTLEKLPKNPLIATSSLRREEAVLQIKSDCCFCDLRGTIEQRLAKLEEEKIDGVIIAEAALIRLSLTHLNRILLPGITVPGQGRLAIIARTEDLEIVELFRCLHHEIH